MNGGMKYRSQGHLRMPAFLIPGQILGLELHGRWTRMGWDLMYSTGLDQKTCLVVAVALGMGFHGRFGNNCARTDGTRRPDARESGWDTSLGHLQARLCWNLGPAILEHPGHSPGTSDLL